MIIVASNTFINAELKYFLDICHKLHKTMMNEI